MSVISKFIDNVDDVVQMAIDGFCMTNPRCQRLSDSNVVVAKEVNPKRVALICGGGSGHEPAHVGFVARGWLSAAVCGSVFACPPTAHVSAAINYLAKRQKESNGNDDPPGILVIIKNYAGDVLNFEFAIQQARVQGIRVDSVLAADDVVFGTDETSKRRGLAGTCLLYKILGAAAAKGATLEELKTLACRISRNLRTIGASLSSCALPGGPPSSTIPPHCVEIGLGIHGEKGLVQIPFHGAHALVAKMMSILLGRGKDDASDGVAAVSTPLTTARITPLLRGAKVVLLVNNLGGTTDMEMNLLAAHALRELSSEGFVVSGVSVGRHMTALDMHGFSLTVLAIEDAADLSFVRCSDALQDPLMGFHEPTLEPKAAPGGPVTALQLAIGENEEEGEGRAAACGDASALRAVLKHVFEHLLTVQSYLNELDAAVGDGDLGSGVHRAAAAALGLLPYLPCERGVERSFTLLAKAVADACAGTSGPLYGALLIGAGVGAQEALRAARGRPGDGGDEAVVAAIRAAIARGSEEVQKLGGARKGDRTMVDVLEALRESPEVRQAGTLKDLLEVCLRVATQAAAATAQLPAKFGRSRYLGGKEIGKKDPGAELVVLWIEAIAGKYKHPDDGI